MGRNFGERIGIIFIAILVTAVLELFGLGWIGAIFLLYVLYRWAMHTSINEDTEEFRRHR